MRASSTTLMPSSHVWPSRSPKWWRMPSASQTRRTEWKTAQLTRLRRSISWRNPRLFLPSLLTSNNLQRFPHSLRAHLRIWKPTFRRCRRLRSRFKPTTQHSNKMELSALEQMLTTLSAATSASTDLSSTRCPSVSLGRRKCVRSSGESSQSALTRWIILWLTWSRKPRSESKVDRWCLTWVIEKLSHIN